MKNFLKVFLLVIAIFVIAVPVLADGTYWPDRGEINLVPNYEKANTGLLSWKFSPQQPVKIVIWTKAPILGDDGEPTHTFAFNIGGISKIEIPNMRNVSSWNFVFKNSKFLGVTGNNSEYQLSGVREYLACDSCGWDFASDCINWNYIPAKKSRIIETTRTPVPQDSEPEVVREPEPVPEPQVSESAVEPTPAPAPVQTPYVAPRPAAPRPAAPAVEITAGRSKSGRYFPLAGKDGGPIRHEITGENGQPIRHETKVKVSGDAVDSTPIPLSANLTGKILVDNNVGYKILSGFFILGLAIIIAAIIWRKKS